MQISEYKNIFKNEATHFYYVGYHQIILFLLKRYINKSSKKLNILDAGCGTGLLTKKLTQFGSVWGVDMSEEAVKFAKKRRLNVKKGSVTKIPFKDKTFDVVVSIDVLCHQSIQNDHLALMEFNRVLKPDGLLVLKLPAYNWLHGSHDLLVQTKKRYADKDFSKEVKKAKFKILYLTYLGSFLLPIVIFKHLKEILTNSVSPHSSVENIWNPLNKLLIFLFKVERFLLQIYRIPFGISFLLFARKK